MEFCNKYFWIKFGHMSHLSGEPIGFVFRVFPDVPSLTASNKLDIYFIFPRTGCTMVCKREGRIMEWGSL